MGAEPPFQRMDSVSARLSNMQTLMNLLKGTAGTGVLSLPEAFKNAGLWVGFFLFLLIAAVAVHAMHILVGCAERLEKRSKVFTMNYPDVMEQAFTYGPESTQKYASFMRHFVNTLIHVLQCGFCCIYIIWVSVNVKEVIDQYWTSSPDVRVYEVLVFLLLLPYVMVRSLKTIAIFSAFANLLYLFGLIIIFQYMLRDLPDASERPAFKSWETLPNFFGTAVFAFESICLVSPLRSKMREVDAFGGWAGVLNLGMSIITAVYTATGFYGYLRFGEDVASTITLNLPKDDWLYLSVNLIFAMSMFISVGVQFYVPITVIWPYVEEKFFFERSSTFKSVAQCGTRACLLTLILVIAILVPHLDLLMSLVGSLLGSLLAMILPAIIELVTLSEEGELTALVVAKDAFIMCFGVVGLLTGSYTSLVAIFKTF